MRVMTCLALAAALALGACGGDDDPAMPDAPAAPDAPGQPDAGPDAAMPPETLTTYVIDLIENGTADTTDPRPFAEFSTLPDPDVDNPNAYDSLFP
jgi:hypothetical protein